MKVNFYNFDKVDKVATKIIINEVEHDVKKPTVGLIAEYSNTEKMEDKMDLLGAKMAPTVNFDELTPGEAMAVYEICGKALVGDEKGKPWDLEEIKTTMTKIFLR